MKKELKSIELDDLKELQTMLKDFWTTQLVEASKADILEDIRRLLSPKCYSYLIMCDDNIAGFIYINEKYGYVNNIEYLYIKEKFRGNGLGSFALSKIKEILKEDGLYHSLGFNNIDTLTLSTGIVGDTEVKNIFDLDFKINKLSLFAHKKQ